MATNIPPHNLREIIDATMLLIEKPETALKEVMKLVPGPDFPTGGYIAGREGIEAAYKSGRGSFTMRAKAAIEDAGKDRENIVITEIPYQVNKATLIKRIAELAQNKKIDGIADVRDESDRDGMRIVVELKRGEESQLVLNNLYKHTQMQESFGMIMLAIAGGQPKEMGILEFIRLFIDHRRDVVVRRTRFELRKAREREHILTGYQVALDHLDDVIRIIRGSSSRAEAKENLLKFFSEQDVTITENGKSKKIEGVKLDGRKYKLGGIEGETARAITGGLTPVQVDAILELQLHRLTQLSVDEILKELKSIRERITELEEILASEKKLKSVIIGELKEIQKDYGDDRRTQIVDKVDDLRAPVIAVILLDFLQLADDDGFEFLLARENLFQLRDAFADGFQFLEDFVDGKLRQAVQLQFEDRIHLNGRQAAGNRARRFAFDSAELVLSAVQLDAFDLPGFPVFRDRNVLLGEKLEQVF